MTATCGPEVASWLLRGSEMAVVFPPYPAFASVLVTADVEEADASSGSSERHFSVRAGKTCGSTTKHCLWTVGKCVREHAHLRAVRFRRLLLQAGWTVGDASCG